MLLVVTVSGPPFSTAVTIVRVDVRVLLVSPLARFTPSERAGGQYTDTALVDWLDSRHGPVTLTATHLGTDTLHLAVTGPDTAFHWLTTQGIMHSISRQLPQANNRLAAHFCTSQLSLFQAPCQCM